MKSLADFKRKLRIWAADPARTISIINKGPDGTERHKTENVPIDKVQTKDFCVRRADGRRGWVSFDKAADWTYSANTATHKWHDDGKTFGTTIVIFNGAE